MIELSAEQLQSLLWIAYDSAVNNDQPGLLVRRAI